MSHVGLNVSVFNTYSLLLWHPTARNCDVGDQETDVTPRPEEAGYGLKLHMIRPSGEYTITLQNNVTRGKADANCASIAARQRGDLHSSTQSQTAIILPSGDQAHPLQSRVGSCVRFARTQPVALQKMDRKSTQSCGKDAVEGSAGAALQKGPQHLAFNDGKERAVGGERYVAGFRVRNVRDAARGKAPDGHAHLAETR